MHFFKILFLAMIAAVSAEERVRPRERVDPKHKLGVEKVKEHHERRMAKLEELIEERRQAVEAHEAGHKTLSQEEYERVSRQHVNFQRKLEQMHETNHHEAHVERMHEMNELHERTMRSRLMAEL